MLKKRNINLIEILAVTAIVAVLATFGVSKFNSMAQRAKITKTTAQLESISAALVNYKREYGELPYTGEEYPESDMAVNFSDILPILRGDNKRGIDFLTDDVASDFATGEGYDNYSFQIALDYDHSDTIDANVFSGKTTPEITEDLLASSSVWMRSPNEGHADIYSWVSLDLNNANSGLIASNDTPIDVEDLTTEETYPESDTDLGKVKSNNGHGNNEDGVDSSNPGNSKEGEDTDPTVDDEMGGGSSNGNGNSGNNGNGNGNGNNK